jgi:negative regulator of flagellin synthesis FlgM
MTIDRINSIDPIPPGKKPGQNNRINEAAKSDSIAVSSEAVEKGELYQAIEVVSSASDVRADRIAELREKINDPSYINDTIVNATADKIMEAFGL